MHNNYASLSEIFCIQPNGIGGDASVKALVSAAQGSKYVRVCFVLQPPTSAPTRDLIENLRRMKTNVTVLPDPTKAGFWDTFAPPGINDWMRYLFLDWLSPDANHTKLSEDDIRNAYKRASQKWWDVSHQFVIFGGEDFKATMQPGAREPQQIQSMTFFERCLRTALKK